MTRDRFHSWLGVWAAALALWSMGAPEPHARADDRFAIEAFDPPPQAEGSLLALYGTRTYRPRVFTFSASVSYARKLLTLTNARQGNTLAELMGSLGTLNLMGAVGLWKRLDVGVALPIHRVSQGSTFQPAAPRAVAALLMDSTEIALGDLRVVPRLNLIEPRERGFGLALLTQLYLPTGKDEYYMGEPFRIEPRVSADYRAKRGALVALNAGYLVRSPAKLLGQRVDDMLRLGAGADVPIALGFSALLEVDAQFNLFGSGSLKANAPTEGFLALRYRYKGLQAQLGGGTGLVRGIGAPRYRLFAALGFTRVPPPDSDQDRIADKKDACPSQPEDKDGFQDDDGCPDPDNDGDAVPDATDRCRGEPEDKDGFQDDDGCPDPDNDGDGIADTHDRCVSEPEDGDGFQDDDGCPDPDNDDDGIIDASDRCPHQPGVLTEQGCPPRPVVATLTETEIELHQAVPFESRSAVIERAADPLLDEVAALLIAHPEIERVVIEGHSDSTGYLLKNRRLSEARAEAVRAALIERSIAPERLVAVGIGAERPVADNATPEGRAQNRRVELHIVRRSGETPEQGR